jgi:hypothetical protein
LVVALRWFRARARAGALGLLWSLSALGVLSMTVHERECQDELAIGFVVHDPSSHTIADPRTGEEPAHCLICHWVRTFSADGVRGDPVLMAFAPAPPPRTGFVQSTRAMARVHLPVRAPPA